MGAISRENLEFFLEDLDFPADRDEIIDHVLAKQPHESIALTLRALPKRKYSSPADVGFALDPVQPPRWSPPPRHPKPESGAPPGGEHYARSSTTA